VPRSSAKSPTRQLSHSFPPSLHCTLISLIFLIFMPKFIFILQARKVIAMLSQDFIFDGCTILVHGFSRVVFEVLKLAAQNKKLFRVFCTGFFFFFFFLPFFFSFFFFLFLGRFFFGFFFFVFFFFFLFCSLTLLLFIYYFRGALFQSCNRWLIFIFSSKIQITNVQLCIFFLNFNFMDLGFLFSK